MFLFVLYLFFDADIAGFNDCFNIVGRSVELEASVGIVMKARPTEKSFCFLFTVVFLHNLSFRSNA